MGSYRLHPSTSPGKILTYCNIYKRLYVLFSYTPPWKLASALGGQHMEGYTACVPASRSRVGRLAHIPKGGGPTSGPWQVPHPSSCPPAHPHCFWGVPAPAPPQSKTFCIIIYKYYILSPFSPETPRHPHAPFWSCWGEAGSLPDWVPSPHCPFLSPYFVNHLYFHIYLLQIVFRMKANL